ncbi:ATP-dependent DNA helicase RecG [Thiohalophilus thiocyanatoxydans]|uniref:ATP-dependent DNA helicase RecG n=1 Tax=Thiohalophilus thiocyanatoxydans TaxID=381308 RepID=A0A4R8J182_9GAMM|nr:ATP-dependent DNA helicase RecG [Thiohalophilus thiocyanatoxydans]TDY04067.1 ATP-dependent DNA helicase RecG [Thiohalophilus thiocyanatoxydans]
MIMPIASATELTRLKGVGPKMAERFARLGIDSVEQLLFHLPLRYEDRTRVTPLGALRAGMHAVIQGEVQLSEIKFARRRMLLVRLSDRTGFITLRFFHFNARQQENLARGNRVRAYGEVRRGSGGLEMVHPEFSVIETDAAPVAETGLTPVYPTTEGLHQLTLRNALQQALALLRTDRLSLPELLPAGLLAADELPDLKQALLFVHQPPPETDLDELLEARHPVMQRLILEDLLAHVLSLRQLRQRSRTHQARPLSIRSELGDRFLRALPFALTAAQQRVVAEIETDLGQAVPMQRLVQGDVGSGKTVVAALAALAAVASGCQAAIMAPTEILAEQHYHNFAAWLAPLGIEVAWLSGKAKQGERRAAGEALASGQAAVAVGTHALFQEAIQFRDLALVIIDEQHRFGVHQRLALREKGRRDDDVLPHQLIMTATPIPRTLSMAVYADLDCSVIDELPPGRQPVETVVLPDSRRDDVVERVHRACQQGNQVYWVCTLIEESEALQCQAAEETARLLQAALPDVRVGLVHGRLKAPDKEAIMARFKAGELDLLVATTVIEVGVDVPNAGLMIIENAERLGLAQLHQLRGRVGRGGQASVCVLMYHGALSANARERLAVMRNSNDGFEIARKDMELRGPGEVLGTRQTGLLQLKIADLQRDEALMPKVVSLSDQLLKQYPGAVQPLIQRWVGQAVRYGSV